MADEALNHATRAFRRHAVHSGCTSLVESVPGRPGRFRVKLDKNALARLPGHVFRSIGVAGRSGRRDIAA